MKIHVISDPHVEFISARDPDLVPFPKAQADVCVLAGDVCTATQAEKYESYLRRLKEDFEEVVFVAGNHEFYGTTMQEGISKLQGIAARTGTHFLDVHTCPSVTIKGVRFWGSTLWTDFGGGEYKTQVQDALADYRAIIGIHPDQVEEVHERTKALVDLSADVIVTHHMPVLRGHSRHPTSPITYGFCCTGMEKMVENSSAQYWVYGHTHDNTLEVFGQTKLVSNQVGYRNEPFSIGYDPYMVLEVH